MGNCISCIISSKVPSDVVKVIGLYGNVQKFETPMKAAELMLDNPGHFLCHSTALQTGRRISALSADVELELGHLYFLLPMHKLHSSLSPSEMTSLAFKADSVLHKSTSNSKSRAAGDVNEEINGVKERSEKEDVAFVPRLRLDDAGDVGEMRGLRMRVMSPKYWKPALEAINENE